MKLELDAHLDDLELAMFRGLRINVWHLYDTLTALGWKVDREESNLMIAMSRTWRDAGIKVWIRLARFVCAPPDEVECLDTICFYRFDPKAMPTDTMYDVMYDEGDEKQDWFPRHREEWDWLIRHGDPQFDTFDILTLIPPRDVPRAIRDEASMDLEEAIEPAADDPSS